LLVLNALERFSHVLDTGSDDLHKAFWRPVREALRDFLGWLGP